MSVDYGRYPMENGNLPNRDTKTGIRYGIYPSRLLADWVVGELEPVYYYVCECGKEFGNDYPEHEHCPECGEEFTRCYWDSIEPVGWVLESDGIEAEMDELGDLWVYKSPVCTWGSHASPCAPGAVYIDGTGGDVRAYGLPQDWLGEDA